MLEAVIFLKVSVCIVILLGLAMLIDDYLKQKFRMDKKNIVQDDIDKDLFK